MIIGIDEAGRGAWAGPLTASAVILINDIQGLRDSKLMTKNQRLSMLKNIQHNAVIGIGWVSNEEIDKYGLTIAQTLSMQRAIQYMPKDIPIIIDGNINYLSHVPNTKFLINADAEIPAVMAASIVAKTFRDKFMQHIDNLYPQYIFSNHVGYGTKLHKSQLLQFGPCKIHRKSFKPIRALGV